MIGVPNIPKSSRYLTYTHKSVVLLSGGLDSTTLAYWLAKRGLTVECLYLDYEQGHMNAERDCAISVAKQLSASLYILEISRPRDLLRKIVGKRNDNVELFTDAVSMCTIAATFAFEIGADLVYLGVNADNMRMHPPLQNKFFHDVERLASHWMGNNLRLLTPFLNKNKSAVMKLGTKVGVPFEKTWSCGVNVDKHCGECVGCLARRQAFIEVGLADPTRYEREI